MSLTPAQSPYPPLFGANWGLHDVSTPFRSCSRAISIWVGLLHFCKFQWVTDSTLWSDSLWSETPSRIACFQELVLKRIILLDRKPCPMMLKAGRATKFRWQVIILVLCCSMSSIKPSTNFANNLNDRCQIILNVVLIVLKLQLVVINQEQRKECRSYQQEECDNTIPNGRHDVNVHQKVRFVHYFI